ncbi:PTS sugar transporter subunit IIA [Facklamia miroungae]|uniref:PTS system, glucose-specific IIA component/PTS system, trehalose-specific IIC component n=1 Tax=Facklamia miroungae TaxID=120956 RepID=A0A1G7QVZ6_9LACT|nr:PTS glucose transporter subunit IIA [Facklamia miroungae]NKZ29085.1 PTS glucose transporter subunit IIA [Facklamia miroungae]SDG02698.1 PTS system, glucose-specific IIA component/PTS system, trehalose-specific IIC component [Facklamia miroungae]
MFGLFKKKPKKISLHAVCDGDLIPLEQVNDQVFSKKMMGDGFAIKPHQSTIYSPVEGKVMNIFPTQHAIGIQAKDLEILLHMGLDTVELEGRPFNTLVTEGESLSPSTALSEVDYKILEEADKDNVMLVIFVNGSEVIEDFNLTASGSVTKGQEIGSITLR